MWYIKHIRDYFKNSITILSHWYVYFWLQYTYILFLTLLKIKPRTLTKRVELGDVTITIQNNFVSFLVMQEIFIEQLYKRLHGLNHVLDLGWYIGDSAIYLSKINNHVTVVESDPKNFALCQVNTRNLPNVTIHNWAVVWNDEKRFIVDNNEYRWEITKETDNEDAKEIATISIQDLEKQGFDGIKMDIEWWEYELIAYWLEAWTFSYKKWFIEFHFFKWHKKHQFEGAWNFIQMLVQKWYMFEFFGNDGRLVSTVDTMKQIREHTLPFEYLNIYFEK